MGLIFTQTPVSLAEIGISEAIPTYLQISHVEVDRPNSIVRAVLSVFYSHDARLSGARPISTMTLCFADEPNIFNSSNILELLYNKVKSMPEFSAAQDQI